MAYTKKVWVIMANSVVEGVILTSEEDAFRATEEMRTTDMTKRRQELGKQDGEYMPYNVYWRPYEVNVCEPKGPPNA